MASHLILVENLKDWQGDLPDVTVATAKDYLVRPEQFKARDTRIINLCRSYRYLSTGYYCSLLAEARRHKVVPSVRTITDLSSKAIYSLNVGDLDELVHRALRKHPQNQAQDRFEVNVFFGQCDDRELQELARQLFDVVRCPLLRVEFRRQQQWQIHSLRPVHLNSLKPDQRPFFIESLAAYLGSRWRGPRQRAQSRYDLAVLYNPEEKLPPSNMGALRRFIDAGKKMGVAVELIRKKDYNQLAEYDALFIRETTAIDHYTYRFAKKAEAEGMVVIDDPDSIVKCTNKVYLAELLAANQVPAPRTVILRKGEPVVIGDTIGFPAVVKIPDSSFSRGIYRVENAEQANEVAARLFHESDLILAQEYLYTEFDWRIGILNNEVLFACQYFMSPAHWQIVRHGPSGRATEGGYQAWRVGDVPAGVVDAACRAARLIGDGFYGVDIKHKGERIYVIEVNDNPNVETGVEDGVLGADLYRRIIEEFVRRLDESVGVDELRREGSGG
jgi:glutathione synthase/RimK-type ligase-like ATP-grasp enzyme